MSFDQLRAFWRMEYITGPKQDVPGGNPFTWLPSLGDDREAHIVWRGRWTYLVLNRYPYNPGHLLALPYRAVPTLDLLEPAERHALMDTFVVGQELLSLAFRPDGFNTGFNFGAASGAGIPRHLHGHIVPRWNGDSNFMPVIGETRILPEALDATWARLVACAPRLSFNPEPQPLILRHD